MVRQREKSELEFLRAENKKMKSQVKHLKKELSRKTKREHQYTDLEEREAEELLKLESEEKKLIKHEEVCPDCGKDIELVDIGPRKLATCECGYRKVLKK